MGKGGRREQPLAATPTERQRRAGHEERHVAPQARGELEQLVARHGVTGQPVHRDAARPRHRSIRRRDRPARECAWSRARWTPNRCPVASSTIAAARTARFSSGGPDVRAVDLDGDPARLPPLRAQRVGQAHEAEQRLDAVVAIGLSREHAQEQVELGVRLER